MMFDPAAAASRCTGWSAPVGYSAEPGVDHASALKEEFFHGKVADIVA